mgnify:CR=1 FL=1
MAKLKACSIHDVKAEAWMTPMFFQSSAQAVRSFGDAVRDGTSEFGKHPEDYNLFCVGEFDQDTGEVFGFEPIHLIAGINVKEL